MLNFDQNATAPLSATAREAWLRAVEQFPGNPSSRHRLGQRAERAMETAREELAALLGCPAEEIVWTSGATESVNTAIRFLATSTAETVALSTLEHPCTRESAQRYLAGRVETLPATVEGTVRVAFSGAWPGAVALMAANNETGVLQPWAEAAAACTEHGVPLLCDAAQWIGKLPAAGLGACRLVAGCGHKFGGPQGVGFLKAPVDLQPLLVGGPQEEGRRAGTENVAGVLAMVAALQEREALLATGGAEARARWREEFIGQLLATIPGARVLGAGTARLWNTVSVLMPEHDCRYQWVVKLDRHGVAASTGSACAAGAEKPSHVLAAMGLTQEEMRRVVRLSSGWETTSAQWEELLAKMAAVAAELHGAG